MVRPFINTPSYTLEHRDNRRKTEVFRKTQQVVQYKVERSRVIDLPATDSSDSKDAAVVNPRFDRHEIVEGKVIGRGGFCVIREINAIVLDDSLPRRPSGASHKSDKTNSVSTDNDKSSTHGLRVQLAEQAGTKPSSQRKPCKYVLKELIQPDPAHWHKTQGAYMNGVVDLAMEAQYLAHLQHPHILTLRGISTSNQFGADDGMFLVLEYLPETLAKRLNVWAQRQRAYRGVTGFVTRSRGRAAKLLQTRVQVARDIADAMQYLHAKQIIFRDLKPDNLGFNSEDQIKLFDFGLAKELIEEDRQSNGLYRNMTGFTGAIRYMAPEVGRRKAYNLSADVYSWTMVLWHIMALEPPLGLYTPDMMVDRVFRKGHRPVVQDEWPESIKTLLRSGWAQDIGKRPSMEHILVVLDELLTNLAESS